MSLVIRYWDSATFLAWLKRETGKFEKCRGVIRCAEKGEIRIVTSVVTITEVLYLKGHEKMNRERSREISQFFENPYIEIQNLDRFLAERARELVWDFTALRPKDAIHVATAEMLGVDALDTFDEYLLKLDGKIGNPPLRITIPDIPSPDML